MTLTIDLPVLLQTLNQILTAGVSITAISLMMYSLGFNFRDRVAQTFGLILVSVVLIYTSEIIANISNLPSAIQFWLQVKWVGLVMLPAAYLHFSDALLTLTGRPSRGRRRWLVRIVYAISTVGAVLVFFGITVGMLAPDRAPMPYLQRNTITLLFGIYYIIVMLLSGYNLIRAVLHSITTTSRRRLFYLFSGATAPAISSVIFLFHGNLYLVNHPVFFWVISIIGALLTGGFLVLMAYAVSFFGVSWTDRAIKSRLFRWLLRGPLVAAAVLGGTTIVRRYGETLGNPYIASVPIVMVGTILVLEYAITLLAPKLEKSLFFGDDREDLAVISSLEDRMLTKKDLNQFLETIAASICDRLQSSACFIVILEGNAVDSIIYTGDRKFTENFQVTGELINQAQNNDHQTRDLFEWGDNYLMPLEFQVDAEHSRLLGLCGFSKSPNLEMHPDDMDAVRLLCQRAALALKDRALQKQVISSISALQTEVDYIQGLRASTTYDQNEIFNPDKMDVSPELTEWVKDALTHYWGGPKLTNNPLLDFKIVQEESNGHEGNRTNGLRAVLKEAIEGIKPEGERKFTADWLLYNILDLKFVQGKKVREVAHKLSVSEADLYRKQRIALESVARNIMAMELGTTLSGSHPDEKKD